VPKKGGAGREHRDEPHRICEDRRREGPRSWRASDVEGVKGCWSSTRRTKRGSGDIEPGQRIVIVFNLHEGPAFFPDLLRQMPPHRCQGQPGVDSSMGIFSICSPVRPNPIGMSVLEVLGVEGNVARVRGLDPRPQALPCGRQLQLPRVRKGAAGIGVSASGAGGGGRREHGKRSSTKLSAIGPQQS
jgi:tRNA (Thr-GGU) A37 N-methylase